VQGREAADTDGSDDDSDAGPSKKRKSNDEPSEASKKVKVANDKKGAIVKKQKEETDAEAKTFSVGMAMGRKRAKGKRS
jgi:hypothetical protein